MCSHVKAVKMKPLADFFVFPPKPTLVEFNDIWEHCFIFGLASCLFAHFIAALVAFTRLRKHKWGRWFSAFIIIFGVITPLTYGAITSAAIAGIYTASNFGMAPIYSVVWGFAMTTLIVLLSYTRFLFTL